jgi:hypothetical protein
MERIETIWTPDAAAHRLAVCYQLIYDTLALLPSEYDVAEALHTVRESLDLHNF